MTYFVYILKCADGTLYVGSTNDLAKRIIQHNTAKAGAHYTKIRRPAELVMDHGKAWTTARQDLAVALFEYKIPMIVITAKAGMTRRAGNDRVI